MSVSKGQCLLRGIETESFSALFLCEEKRSKFFNIFMTVPLKNEMKN